MTPCCVTGIISQTLLAGNSNKGGREGSRCPVERPSYPAPLISQGFVMLLKGVVSLSCSLPVCIQLLNARAQGTMFVTAPASLRESLLNKIR